VAVDKAFIQNTFAEGTTAYKWLSNIAEESNTDLALQMAYSLIQKHNAK